MHNKNQKTIQFLAKIKFPNEKDIESEIKIPINISFTDGKEINSENVSCHDTGEHFETFCTYKCQLNVQNNNISKVKLNDKENKYTLSSLANITKDISSQKKNNFLDIKNISTLNQAKIYRKSGSYFVIKGDLDSEYESNNIKLITSKNTYRKELSCKGYKGKEENRLEYYYFLNCEIPGSTINMNLQNTFSYLEDDKEKGFIINFEKFNNSTIIQTNNYIPKKKSSGLSTGGIIAIAILGIILLLLVSGLIYFLKSRAPTPPLKELANNSNTIGAAGASSEVVVNQ